VGLSCVSLMNFDAGQIGGPNERGFFGGNDVVELLFTVTYQNALDPGGDTLGAVFLLEALAGHPVRITYEREGSTFDVSEQRGRDLQIELNELGLDDAGFRKETFVQVADLNLTLANLGDCSFPGHVTSYKRRGISLFNNNISAKTI